MKCLRLLQIFSLILPFSLFASTDLTFNTPCNTSNEQIILSFVGDILIHKPLYLTVMNQPGKVKHFSTIWEKTIPLFLKADFSIGNVEGPTAMGIDEKGGSHGDVGFIYDDFIYSGTNLVFNYHPRLLSDLQDSGFNMVTAANNHSMDRGSIGINKTIDAAAAIGLKMTGLKKYKKDLSGEFYSVAKIKEMNVAFIGCTEFLNEPDKLAQVLTCESKETMSLIKTLSQSSDIDAVIVFTHWGVEYSTEVKDYQRDFAHRFIDAGAAAVIGSHPHVLETWEKYTTGNNREGLIFYSLGNFVAKQAGVEKQTGAVLYMGLSKKSKTEKAKVFAAAFSPTFRDNLSVIPLTETGNADANKNIEKLYGKKNRIGLSDKLMEKMCSLNHFDN
jgi:hypothetical protein